MLLVKNLNFWRQCRLNYTYHHLEKRIHRKRHLQLGNTEIQGMVYQFVNGKPSLGLPFANFIVANKLSLYVQYIAQYLPSILSPKAQQNTVWLCHHIWLLVLVQWQWPAKFCQYYTSTVCQPKYIFAKYYLVFSAPICWLYDCIFVHRDRQQGENI